MGRKHVPATHEHPTLGSLLLGNGAVNRLHQQYKLCVLRCVVRAASIYGSQLSVGDSHGKLVADEKSEVGL
jgi:hypothetical protein